MQIWYVRRPPSDRACRRRGYSTSEQSVGDAGDAIKLGADSGVDVTEINLVDMNPDDIRVCVKTLLIMSTQSDQLTAFTYPRTCRS